MKNPREFLMYFVPSGEPEGPSVLRGDSIELKCFWGFLKHMIAITERKTKKFLTFLYFSLPRENDRMKHDQNCLLFR